MNGFTKLFSTILTSTIWREDDKTRIVWITMLALADGLGNVAASVPGLAAAANVSLEDCLASIKKLSSPDTWSRTKSNDGRRIEEIEGGWLILNYVKYRELGKQIDRSLYLRDKQREHRSRSTKSTSVNKPSTSPSASASVSVSGSELGRGVGEGELQLPGETRKRFIAPTVDELNLMAEKIGLPENEVIKFQAFYESNGWKVGKNPMKSVSAAMAGWKARWEERRNNTHGNQLGNDEPEWICEAKAQILATAAAIERREKR